VFSLDDTYNVVNGEKLSTGQISIFIIGVGNFKGKRTSTFTIPTVDPPNRKPDETVMQQTSIDQVKNVCARAMCVYLKYMLTSKARIHVVKKIHLKNK